MEVIGIEAWGERNDIEMNVYESLPNVTPTETQLNIECDETVHEILKEYGLVDGTIQIDVKLSREDIDERKLKQAVNEFFKSQKMNIVVE